MKKRCSLMIAFCLFMAMALPAIAAVNPIVETLISWPDDAIGQVLVQTSGNIREGGSSEYKKMSKASVGDLYYAVGQAETGWYAITLDDGRTGYISPKLVSFASRDSAASESASTTTETKADTSSNFAVANSPAIIMIESNGYAHAALDESGELYIWGGYYEQMDRPKDLPPIMDVGMGSNFVVALDFDGKLHA